VNNANTTSIIIPARDSYTVLCRAV